MKWETPKIYIYIKDVNAYKNVKSHKTIESPKSLDIKKGANVF